MIKFKNGQMPNESATHKHFKVCWIPLSGANKACFIIFLNLIFKEIKNVIIFMIVKYKEKIISIVLCEMLHSQEN